MAAPWKTLDRLQAAQSSLRPGDTVYFRGGDYVVGNDNRSYYSWRARGVTYRNSQGETPVIVYDRTVPNPNVGVLIWFPGSDSIIDGLNFRMTERTRKFGQSPDGDYIRESNIVNSALSVNGSNNIIRNCSIEGFVLGIAVGGNNLLVENCRITGTISHGFYISGQNGTFRYNEVDGSRGYRGAYAIQIQYRSSTGNKIYGNLLKNGRASGIVFSGPISNNEAFNNILINSGSKAGGGAALAFYCYTGPIGGGNKFYNNTAIGISNGELISSGSCGSSGPIGRNVEVYNNIFHPSMPVRVGLSTDKIRNNVFYNIKGSVPPGNTLINPNLKNPGGTTSEDAMLQEGSPAIDKAPSGAPALDYRSGTRPVGAAADIGAFESGAPPGSGGGPLGSDTGTPIPAGGSSYPNAPTSGFGLGNCLK